MEKCFPVTKVVRYRAKKFGHLKGEYAMMKELRNGPITCGIACNHAFTWEYSAGIFYDTTGFKELDHDVEIVGWGEEDGVKFWHARNSWGTFWGMNGFFKIVRGVDNLGIESDCHFVVPDIVDEELVFEERPIYGGSHYGIRPFRIEDARKHTVPDTSDVAIPEQLTDQENADDSAVGSNGDYMDKVLNMYKNLELAKLHENGKMETTTQPRTSIFMELSVGVLAVCTIGAGFYLYRTRRRRAYSMINH